MIAVPPIEEQKEIVRRVAELFAIAVRIKAQYRAARARVDRLTQSLLAKAFRGALVPQDPQRRTRRRPARTPAHPTQRSPATKRGRRKS